MTLAARVRLEVVCSVCGARCVLPALDAAELVPLDGYAHAAIEGEALEAYNAACHPDSECAKCDGLACEHDGTRTCPLCYEPEVIQ